MSWRTVLCGGLVACALCGLGGAVLAQDPPPGDGADAPGELRDALRDHFRNRLRFELGLTDEQLSAVWPKVERLEQERRRLQRDKNVTALSLRRGYLGGASDDELQRLLDRITDIEVREQAMEREFTREIDESLTVRQRVGLRLFVSRFRRELRERVEDIRRQRLEGRDRPRRGWRDRPRRPRP